jgi:phosphoribosylanthranilate isomerase
VPFIKAIRVKPETNLADLAETYSSASALLLDTYRKGIPGGTGEAFDWNLIPSDMSLPVILAGGLAAANVAEAIRTIRPMAVDVSGGVERGKGIKDAQRIREFIKEVNQVGAS